MERAFKAQQDLERYAPDLLQIDALYAAAGRPAPGAVPHPLIYYASSKTVIELLDALLQVARAPRHPRCEDERTRLCSALDAFEEIVEAIRRYDVDRRFQPPPSTEGRKALRRLADRPTRKSLESLLARNDLRPDYLSALWLAAIELGLLRMSAGAVEVLIQRSWHRTGYAEDDWLLALAEEPASLRAIARKATEEFSVPKSGHLRPFRELRSEPDGNKFLRLIAKPPGASDESIPLLMARYAARRLYGGDLPADWAQQIARDPVLIKKMARLVCACRHFRHAIRGTGPVPDPALDAYGQALCAIYERLAGQPITYGTRTNLEAKPPQAERTGLGLGFVRAGVKLIDPATTVSQAQRHIDRRRRWRRLNRSRVRN
jgi:hypothetical protein